MSAIGLKPTFTTIDEWKVWRRYWKIMKNIIDDSIRVKRINMIKAHQENLPNAGKLSRELHFTRITSRKMLDLLEDGRARMRRIIEMEKQIAEQNSLFPLTIENCKTIDFHFNKGSNEFKQLPMWIVKTKGKSFYVNHVTSSTPWSTRETPEGSTRGMLRFKNSHLNITKDGEAIIQAV